MASYIMRLMVSRCNHPSKRTLASQTSLIVLRRGLERAGDIPCPGTELAGFNQYL